MWEHWRKSRAKRGRPSSALRGNRSRLPAKAMLPICSALRQASLDPDDDGEQRGLWARRRPQQEEETRPPYWWHIASGGLSRVNSSFGALDAKVKDGGVDARCRAPSSRDFRLKLRWNCSLLLRQLNPISYMLAS